jgi:hypothetical protein
MRASKYLLEIWGIPVRCWYVTLSQILDRTAPDLYFLTTAHSQDRIDIVIRNSCSEVQLLDWALLLATVLLESMHLFIISQPICDGFFLVITFPCKTLSQVAFLADFSSLRTPNENHQLHLTKPRHWGRLFVHYPKPFRQSSCSKPSRIITSREQCQGYFLVWHIFANLEQEWMYLLQPWR